MNCGMWSGSLVKKFQLESGHCKRYHREKQAEGTRSIETLESSFNALSGSLDHFMNNRP